MDSLEIWIFAFFLISFSAKLLWSTWSSLYVHTVAGNIRSFPCLYSTRGRNGTIRFNCILPRKLHPVFILTPVTPSGKGCLSNRIGHRDIRGLPPGNLTGLSTLLRYPTVVRIKIFQSIKSILSIEKHFSLYHSAVSMLASREMLVIIHKNLRFTNE